MNSQERVRAMLDFQEVDMPPVEYHSNLRGLYDHGEALRKMIVSMPGDFEDYSDIPAPVIPEDAYDENGRYFERKTDEWGVEWEYRIFSMMGQAKKFPLADISRFDSYVPPPSRYQSPADFSALCDQVKKVKKNGYCKMGGIGFFEILHAIRPFEDVLMDLFDDSDEIHRLADMIVEKQLKEVHALIAAGVDGIQFGDDFGTQRALMMTPEMWRHFFVPRYKRLIDPIKAAGKDVFFHSCGCCVDILTDLRNLGVDAIWPQLAVYDLDELAETLRSLHLACALHIDRAGVMTRGTSADVEAAVHKTAKAFDIKNGGGWFYIEIDNEFPLANVETLFRCIGEYRR